MGAENRNSKKRMAMFKKKVDPVDVHTEFVMKLNGAIVQAANSVAREWTRAAIIFNQVTSPEGALTGALVCPFIIADGQRFLGKWMPDEQGQDIMRIVEAWQRHTIDIGDRAWTAFFIGINNVDGQYHFTAWNEYDPSYGKWRISENDEVNWWAFHEGFGDKPDA